MKKIVIVLGLAAVLGLGITYVYAQGPGYGSTGWGHGKWFSSAPERGPMFQESHQSFNNGETQFRSGWGMGTGFMHDSRMGYNYGGGHGYEVRRGYRECY